MPYYTYCFTCMHIIMGYKSLINVGYFILCVLFVSCLGKVSTYIAKGTGGDQ